MPTQNANPDTDTFSFIWMDEFDLRSHDGDKTREAFDTLRSLVELVEKAQQRSLQLKGKVGRIRGTLRPQDQRNPVDTVIDDAAAKARRYEFEMARTELVWAQGKFAQALQIFGCHIREHGLGKDRKHVIPFDEKREPTEARLYKHNLIQAALLAKTALNSFHSINTYVAELPSFKLEAEQAFQATRLSHDADMSAMFDRGQLILPPKD